MSGINIQVSGEYPNLWQRGLIQPLVRARANHHCEQCGMEFREGTNLAVSALNRKRKPMIGTVHHLDGNKCNCAMSNLIFLCQRCHYRLHIYGWVPGKPLPIYWRNQPPAWVIQRGLAYEFNQQQVLMEVQS